VDRITRKDLKTDQFALEVGHTVNFFEHHRAEAIRYGAIAIGVIVLAVGIVVYTRTQHAARETALTAAIQVQEAPVGPANPNAPISFPTEEARQAEAVKKFSDVAAKYSGSDEGHIASYYLGGIYVSQGRMAEAEKQFKLVADGAGSGYASLAKLSLAQIYFSDGRATEGEKLLRELMDNPTVFVSKDQATVTLARALAHSKPAEAKKLLDPLRALPGQIGQLAISLENDIPAQ
jgi:predicted negative regulator of RcsB-dependent stress response